ncbi:MAG: efflux RND transporter permease subunit [Candidatus Pacebacteria bacterium]|nr:efflux RND transporter permease subunit [Candidatus Paceibacterota bacterium]
MNDIQNNTQTNSEEKNVTIEQKYLQNLKFNPNLKKSWFNFFVSKFRIVVLIILLITFAGIYCFTVLPRESNPEVKIPIAMITTVYPGGSPSDVEEFVTKKIETGISGIKGVDKITSNSSNSFSLVQVEFDTKEDIDDSIRKVKDKITSIQNNLPDDAKESVVTEISLDDQPIWTIVMTGPYDGFVMREYGENIKDELEKVAGIKEVKISGGDESEFEIAYNPEKLIFYNLSADQANSIIKATNISIPSGNFDGNKFSYPINTNAKIYSIEEIKNIPISHTDSGSVVYLKDLAEVKEVSIKKTSLSRLSTDKSKAQDAITISIIKRTGSSIINTVNEAKEKVNTQISSMPAGIKYDVTTDSAKIVNDDFEQLTHDFILTLVLVFGILFLTVGFKEGVVASLAVPLVFFIAFTCLYSLGISLNFLSLFSLILSLGLLVDDAIVVVSATKQYMRTGKFTPEEAVLLVLNDYKMVLTTTTLTTVWAFLPLLFCSGIIGEFMKSIPITVSITLISSLLIALVINPALIAFLERLRITKKIFFIIEALILISAGISLASGNLWGYGIGAILIILELLLIRWYDRKGKAILDKNFSLSQSERNNDDLIKEKIKNQEKSEGKGLANKFMYGILKLDSVLPFYEKYLCKILATSKSRLITIFGAFGMLIIAICLPVFGIVKSEFFPASDSDYVYVNFRAPVGQKIEQTDTDVKKIEEKLITYDEIKSFSTIVGRSSSGSYSDKSNLASITIILKDKKERKVKNYDFADQLRNDLADIDGGAITITTPSGGPSTGSAFEANIKGDDLNTLNTITNELSKKLSTIDGVINIDISLKDSTPDYTFDLDSVKMSQNNLNAAYIGSALRMAISGTDVSTIVKDGEEIKIVARFAKDKIPTLDDIQNLQILNTKNQAVFLKDVATINLKPSVDKITRVDQKRTVVLSADTTAKTNSNLVLEQFEKKIADYKMPEGYTIDYGGQNEENAESVESIIRAMSIAILLIITTLVIQFNSFRKTFIILITIPLALIGVFIGMAIFNVNLSFPGLIGIMALFGIVVKNAIILVDKIDLNIKSGISFDEAIIDGGKSRLEAIFITSTCTILGILPITLSNETWMSLGGAIIFGLSLSSLFTLFIIPTLYKMLVERE